jgi:serine protease
MSAMTGIAVAALAAALGAGDPASAGTIKAKFVPPPDATITTPAKPLAVQSLHGRPVKIMFAGKGVDAAKQAVPGTRFRWTAYGTGGAKKVLCTGSAVPHPGPVDGLTSYRNCASFTAELGMLPQDVTSTTWWVTLEVFGFGGTAGADTESVRLDYVAL